MLYSLAKNVFALNLYGASKKRNLKLTPKSLPHCTSFCTCIQGGSEILIWDTKFKLPNSLSGIIESTQQLPFLSN